MRAAVPNLVARMLTDASDQRVRESAGPASRVTAIRRVVLTLATAVSYVVLFAGMVVVAVL